MFVGEPVKTMVASSFPSPTEKVRPVFVTSVMTPVPDRAVNVTWISELPPVFSSASSVMEIPLPDAALKLREPPSIKDWPPGIVLMGVVLMA